MFDIYTTANCIYCTFAKRLLTEKGVAFTEYRIDDDPTLGDAMLARKSGLRSVPQIFMQDTYIGGYDSLVLFNANGQLDALSQTAQDKAPEE